MNKKRSVFSYITFWYFVFVAIIIITNFSGGEKLGTSTKNQENLASGVSTYHCWNCGYVSERNRSVNCSSCGWDKCPNCNACYWDCPQLNIIKPYKYSKESSEVPWPIILLFGAFFLSGLIDTVIDMNRKQSQRNSPNPSLQNVKKGYYSQHTSQPVRARVQEAPAIQPISKQDIVNTISQFVPISGSEKETKESTAALSDNIPKICCSDIIPGDSIHHKTFGEGRVISKDSKNVCDIAFLDKVRTISLEHCIKLGLIQKSSTVSPLY